MDGDVIPNGGMVIEKGEIVAVGEKRALQAQYPQAQSEHFETHALFPGLINCHTHLDLTAHKNYSGDPVRSLASEVHFSDWLLSTIDFKKNSSPETLRSAVEQGLEECIEAGTTSVADMGSFDGIIQTVEDKGMRAVLFPEVLSYSSAAAQNLYETAMALVEKYQETESDLITVGMGPYSPYTLSRNILKILAQYCRASGIPLMMHAAQSFAEMEFFYNSTGELADKLFPNIGWGDNLPPAFHKTPIEYLQEIGFLETQPLLVGCVNATQSDIERLAKAQAKVVWCPRSNHYLKLGRFPLVDYLEKGVTVVLGTEGLSSNNSYSLWDELRFASELSHSQGITAKALLEMVTTQAAFALGLEKEVGSLSVGKRADYVAIDLSHMQFSEDIYSELLRSTHAYHVHKVVVNGKTLKSVN